MVNYKDLGLVNTREMFKRAVAGGYAIPAFNFNTMEQMQAIVQAAVETKSPVIMQVSKGARNYANATILRYMAEGAVAYAKELGCEHPEIVLHLDHGDSFELCKDCIDMGFSSVMYDGSALPYEENIKISRQVVEYAKELGCEHPEIVLHLDHGDSFELCKDCIDNGFSSVMIDGSSLPYEECLRCRRRKQSARHTPKVLYAPRVPSGSLSPTE